MKSVYGKQIGQGQEMTLTEFNHILLSTPSASTSFQVSGCNRFKKKSIVFTFSHAKAYVSKIDLAVNRSRSSQGHHFAKL